MDKSDIKKIQNLKATEWAEEHGIIEYKVQGWNLIYNVSYPAYLGNPRYTVQFTIDLHSGTTINSKRLKRFDCKGLYNRH